MVRARRAAAALGATALVGMAVPGAHAADPAAPGTIDQGAPRYYNSGLAPTPYMGWNTYYGLGAPTESEVKSVADHLVSSGLRDAGYNIVWLDGGWQADTPRDSQGRLTPNATRFPSGLPSLVTYLHQHGLKAGIYTDAGTYDGGKSCGLGSRGYYEQDAQQFADWKFDAVKADFLCGIGAKLDPGPAFKQFSDALAKTGRPMLLNICNPLTDDWGLSHTPAQDAHNTYTYGPTTADSWRTGTDLAFGDPSTGVWPNILRSADANAWHPEAQGPGHYNDPDYLLPMRKLANGSYELNEEESTSQLVLWSVMGAPLVIGSDPRTLPQSMIDTLRNPDILAVDQDPLAIQGVRVATDSTGDVYSKVLQGAGKRAVVLLNRSNSPAQRTVTFADAGLTGSISVRDLRARQDRGTYTGSYTVTVPAHGTAFFKLSGTDAAPGVPLGASSSASPAIVANGTTLTAFTRDANGALIQRTGSDGSWTGASVNLGGPVAGAILGQPAAYGSAGGRIDVFVRGTDDATYLRTFSGGTSGTWGAWQSIGGQITDAPGVAFRGPGDWTIFARGADGLIWQTGPAGAWSSVGAPGGAATYGRPSAVTDSAGRTHVAVRTADDSIWERVRSASGTWSDWTSLGGTVSGSPTLVAAGSSVYLFARAADYTLWQRNYSAGGKGAWGGWFSRPPFVSGVFDGSLGGAAAPDNTVLIAYRGVNGAVYQSRL
ncbi:glycoside hydrolase family 27 protein [Streptomyces sp. NPDC088733]|uniref:glycoside hydrolase family 27 protein n=1 Tax=Streptomyces sp. NPDC088733 TaxID=3365880 RepID=UPI0038104B8A